MEIKALSQDECRELCALWQKRLRLQDWDVEVFVRRGHDLDVQGRVTITLELKYAKIQLCDWNDCPGDSIAYQDMEITLVHELLHIPFESANPDPTPSEIVGLEQAIVNTAKCLVALSRTTP